jgi:hypothetical protein
METAAKTNAEPPQRTARIRPGRMSEVGDRGDVAVEKPGVVDT